MLGSSTKKTLQDDLPVFSIGWFINIKKTAETYGQCLLKCKLYDPQALASYHFWNIPYQLLLQTFIIYHCVIEKQQA
jgi:hypothetical protein